mmetsp:Transcript_91250/g.195725  ORF Transcript_91250/g.195725 Transcript_91250/m.195725 type:complete len:221 (+) Transcript_91250:305-967(+)
MQMPGDIDSFPSRKQTPCPLQGTGTFGKKRLEPAGQASAQWQPSSKSPLTRIMYMPRTSSGLSAFLRRVTLWTLPSKYGECVTPFLTPRRGSLAVPRRLELAWAELRTPTTRRVALGTLSRSKRPSLTYFVPYGMPFRYRAISLPSGETFDTVTMMWHMVPTSSGKIPPSRSSVKLSCSLINIHSPGKRKPKPTVRYSVPSRFSRPKTPPPPVCSQICIS